MSLDPLRFAVEIQGNAIRDLDVIKAKLDALKNESVTVRIDGLDKVNDLLKSIKSDDGKIAFRLPDLSTLLNQIKNAHDEMKNISDVGKQWNEIPAMANALKQAHELVVIMERLKTVETRNLPNNTGSGSDFQNKLQQLSTSLASVYQELPNVAGNSLKQFVSQLEAETRKVNDIISNIGVSKLSRGVSDQISQMNNQLDSLRKFGDDDGMIGKIKEQVAKVEKSILASIGNVITAVEGMKAVIQHDNFTSFAKRITACTDALDKLNEAFGKFGLTVSHDTGMHNFMVGLGEVIANIRSTMNNIGANTEGGGAITGMMQTFDKSVKDALTNVERLEAIIIRFEQLSKNMANMGFDHKAIDEAIEKAKEYKAIMQTVAGNGGEYEGRTAAMWAMQPDYRTIMSKGMQSLGLTESERGVNRSLSEVEKLTEKIRVLRDLEQQATGKGLDTSGLKSAINELERIKSAFKSMAAHGVSPTYAKEAKEYTRAMVEANKQRLLAQRAMRDYSETDASLDKTNKKFAELSLAIERYEKTLSDARNMNLDVSNLENYKAQLQSVLDLLQQIKTNGGRTDNNLLYKQVINGEYGAMKVLADAENKALEKKIRSSSSTTDFVKEANDEITKLTRLLTNLRSVESNAGKFGIDTAALQQYISYLEQVRDKLFAIRDAGGVLNNQTAKDITGQTAFIKEKEAAIAESAAVKANTAIAKENAATKSALSLEEKKLAQSINAATQQYNHQSQVLSDLRGMMMQYLSVYGAQQFLTEMANITGELELQQKSLEVIIGSASMAQQLYGEIRDLSQQSPYTFQDLLKSTRQLAAFGIETNDLYGTMKALSDIGAGLSVDVQRLILAFGHVRSYGYLSGIQNRQFETAGIDLVGALADRYNKLADAEERAGRAAEHVTRKDVFKKISKKDVAFEDVQAVIMDLDKPGGRFYNMQERQFDTLGGKLRNLRNNYNIMMSEMGQSSKGLLMGSVNILNELTGHWQKYATMIGAVLVPLGMMRIAQLAVNSSIGMQTNAMTRNIVAMARSEVAMRSMNAAMAQSAVTARSWKNLWGATRIFSPLKNFVGGIFGSRGGAGDIADPRFRNVLSKGLNEGTITKSNLMMLGVSKDLTRAQREIALSLAGVNSAQTKVIASSSGLSRVWYKLSFSARAAGIAVRSFAISLGTMFLQMAPLIAITSIIEHVMAVSREAEETARQWRDNAKNDVKEIDDTFKKYGGDATNNYGRELAESFTNDGYIIRKYKITFDPHSLDSAQVQNALNEMRVKLQAFSPIYNGDLVDIYKMEDQYEQLAAMMKKIEDLRYANDINEAIANQLETVIKDSGGVFDDTLTTNMKEFEEAILNGYRKIEKTVSEKDLEKIQKVFPDVKDIDGVKTLFREYVTGVGDVARRIEATGNLQPMFLTFKSGNKNVDYRFKEMTDDMEGAAKNAAAHLSKLYKDGDLSSATTFLEKYIANLETAASISSPEVQNIITKAFLDQMMPILNQNGQGNIAKEVQRKLIDAHFMELINGQLTIDTTPEERRKILDEVTKETIQWGKDYGMNMAEIGRNSAEAFNDAMSAALQFVRPLTEWQRMLKNEHIGDRGVTEFSAFYNTFKKEMLNQSDLITFFAEDMKKKHDELAKEVENGFPMLRHLWNIEIEPDFKIKTSNLDKLKQMRDAVKAKLDSVLNGPFTTNEQKAVREQLQSWLNNADATIILEETAKEYGYLYGEDKNKKKGSGSSTKTYKDEYARRWDERIRIMKEAYNWYDKWEKRVGDTTAINKVNDKYKEIFDEWKNDKILPFNFDSRDVKNYQKYIEQIRDEALGRYHSQMNDKGKNNGQEALRVYRQAASLLAEIDSDNFDRKADEFASAVKRALDDMTRVWDIYSNVRNTTGNESLANVMSGGLIVAGETAADLLASAILEKAGTGIDFSKVLGMSEDDIQTYIESLDVVQENIKGVVEGLKEWQKTKLGQEKSDIVDYAKYLGSLVDLESQLVRIQDEYNKVLEENNRLLLAGKITQEEANRREEWARARRDSKSWQQTSAYANLYSNSLGMAQSEFFDAYEKEMNDLNALLSTGGITLNDYAKKVDALNKIAREFSESGFLGLKGGVGSFLSGGVQGLISYYDKRASEARTNGNFDEADKWKERADTLSQEQKTAEQLVKAFQDLANASNMLGNMFDALGMKGVANAFSDAGGVLGGIAGGASSLSAFGPYGMAAGAAIGGITSLAQLSDKRRERHIQDLKSEVQKIGNSIDLIRKLREREFGYDMGNTRRLLTAMYAGDHSRHGRAMYEYYSRAGVGTGYTQELEALKKQREDYQRMYDEEEHKKKSSSEALEEYKKQIADLDIQILSFTSDLANELWSIDIKGWADQISDALMTAFENGESAAEAYADTVKNILQTVVNKMLAVGIIEPMMKHLQETLFGFTDENGKYNQGLFDVDNPGASMGKVLDYMSKFFGNGGEGANTITAAGEFLTGVEKLLNAQGLSLRSDSASTLSGGISGVTEETASLLAGYVNALRQDVSYERLALDQFFLQMWPSYIETFTASVTHVSSIDNNTRMMMEMMRDGSGALFDEISHIRSRFDNITNGIESVSIR